MASPLAGDLGMHSGRQQVRDVGVSEIVEADTAFELGDLPVSFVVSLAIACVKALVSSRGDLGRPSRLGQTRSWSS